MTMVKKLTKDLERLKFFLATNDVKYVNNDKSCVKGNDNGKEEAV